jgi:signal transduction histidine kinase
MMFSLTNVLAMLDRSRELTATVLYQTGNPPERAFRVAEMLRSLWPSAPLYACLLREESISHLCVLDETGKPRSDWDVPLRKVLARPGKASKQMTDLTALPRSLKLPSQGLRTEAIAFQGRSWGFLALAVPKLASEDTDAVVRAVLSTCCQQLAFHLHVEAQARERKTLEGDLAAQAWLANVGELAGPVSHEFNNFLNTLLLHVAVLETEVPEDLRSDLAEVRRQGTNIAAIIKQFQEYRRRQRPPEQMVDLNRAVRETVATLRLAPTVPGDAPVHLELASDLSPVLGSPSDLKRLCLFLLTNTVAATAPGCGRVTVRTQDATDKVLLQLEDTGPSLGPDQLSQAFELCSTPCQGRNSLELAACKTLVRRLGGVIDVENRSEGGITITVELPCRVSVR